MAIVGAKVESVLSSTLHTAGALAFLGGLVAYVVWSRGARRGAKNPDLLVLGATITYVGILANLFGGFLRTYQPGHPSFWDFGTEPWATIMVVKHFFLFTAMGAAVYLYEIQAPRLVKGKVTKVQTLEGLAVAGTAVSVLLASILGAVAQVTPITGMDDDLAGMDDEHHDPLANQFQSSTFEVRGSATAGGQPTQGRFEVGAGSTKLEAYLYAPPTAFVGPSPAVYRVVLTDPVGRTFTGTSDPGQSDPTSGEVDNDVLVEVERPAVGNWTYAVSADAGLVAPWRLTVSIAGPDGFHLYDTISFSSGFYEINMVMDQGADVSWDWHEHGEREVAFNLHRHIGGQTTYPVQGQWASHNGTWQAPSDGGASLMWSAPSGGSGTYTVQYHVWGDFTLHSIFA